MQVENYKNPYVSRVNETPKTYTKEEALHWVGGNINVARCTMDCLIREGLQQDHTILDFGCGCFRIGSELIKFVGSGKYYCMDADAGLIEAGKKNLRHLGLNTDFKAVVSKDFEFEKLEKKDFDFILAQGVITHMPDSEIVRLFTKIEEYLKFGGKALVSWINGANGEKELKEDKFRHLFEDLIRLSRHTKLRLHEIPYDHPRKLKMLVLTKL